MKINTIIIDDEPKSVSILCNKLERFCPQVNVIATTNDPEKGIQLIEDLEPDLVFLDIQMPQISGFEVLKHFNPTNFEVIFATAHDQYALDAINNSAIGYILKPYDNENIVKAVERVFLKINQRNDMLKMELMLQKMNVFGMYNRKIMIPNREGIEFVRIKDIIHCEGVDGYTKVYLPEGKSILSSQSIGNFVRLLEDNKFFQVHKSHIVNLEYIANYLNEGYLIMEDGSQIPFSKQRRVDFFNFLKNN